MYGKTELQARYELMHTDDISRKISMSVGYVMPFNTTQEPKGSVTLMHSQEKMDSILDHIIEAHEDAGMKVFLPSRFGKGKDPLIQLNTARHLMEYSNNVTILYSDSIDARVAYGMAAGMAKPILLLDKDSDIKQEIEAFSKQRYMRQDNKIISLKAWEQCENDWLRFLAEWKPKFTAEYEGIGSYGQYDSLKSEYQDLPQLTSASAIRLGILLSMQRQFRVDNHKTVRDVAQLEKESGIEGYSVALSRLHERYNK